MTDITTSPKRYSQAVATLAIAKASFRAILRSPSTVLFSIGFPLVFILVFGFLGNNGKLNLKVGIEAGSDTANKVFAALKSMEELKLVPVNAADIHESLQKRKLAAVIRLTPASGTWKINILGPDRAAAHDMALVATLIEARIDSLNRQLYPGNASIASIQTDYAANYGRVYRTIDFILPGQLGFSLLSAGVFGVAFLFLGLRQTLVLKRFFATPVSRSSILIGEGLSRLLFQVSTAVIILLIGHFCFHFTLVNGWVTFLELLVLSLAGLFVFMGLGFIVSGIARNEASVPALANIITLPQFLLAGTFFPIDSFPSWLQPICRILPLTYLNDAMRKVAFDGAHLQDCGKELGMLGIWLVVVYAVAVKVFRWE